LFRGEGVFAKHDVVIRPDAWRDAVGLRKRRFRWERGGWRHPRFGACPKRAPEHFATTPRRANERRGFGVRQVDAGNPRRGVYQRV